MSDMILQDAGQIITGKGFVTVQEPACGAGGMILAAADTLTAQGHDIGEALYVDAIDLSPQCFKMSYIQVSLRGVPATIRHGNSLSLEIFDSAMTPALIPFLMQHGDPFKGEAEPKPVRQIEAQRPPEPPPVPTAYRKQMSLFD